MLSPSQYNAKFQIELFFKSRTVTSCSLYGVRIITVNQIYHFQIKKEFISEVSNDTELSPVLVECVCFKKVVCRWKFNYFMEQYKHLNNLQHVYKFGLFFVLMKWCTLKRLNGTSKYYWISHSLHQTHKHSSLQSLPVT